jgi:hypothetical protein
MAAVSSEILSKHTNSHNILQNMFIIIVLTVKSKGEANILYLEDVLKK